MVTGILSPVHIAVLLTVVLLLFGAKRLPELGKSLGSGLRGFKESLEGQTEVKTSEPLEKVGERAELDAAA